jgi:hypothetical protein
MNGPGEPDLGEGIATAIVLVCLWLLRPVAIIAAAAVAIIVIRLLMGW